MYSLRSGKSKRYSDGVIWTKVIARLRHNRRKVSGEIARKPAASLVVHNAPSIFEMGLGVADCVSSTHT